MKRIYSDIRHLADACMSAESHVDFLNGQIEDIINYKEEELDCWLDEKVLGNPQHLWISRDIVLKELYSRRDYTLKELAESREHLLEVLDKFKEIYESR